MPIGRRCANVVPEGCGWGSDRLWAVYARCRPIAGHYSAHRPRENCL